jgi:hypothetical protein
MLKGLGEIVNEVKEAKSVGEKIRILQREDNKELRGLFELTYDNRLTWALPEGNPPYKPLDKSMDAQGNLYQDMRRMYIFLKHAKSANVAQTKREHLFISMLEEVDPDDAALLLEAKSRKIKGVSKKIIKQAYPEFLDDPANQN